MTRYGMKPVHAGGKKRSQVAATIGEKVGSGVGIS